MVAVPTPVATTVWAPVTVLTMKVTMAGSELVKVRGQFWVPGMNDGA